MIALLSIQLYPGHVRKVANLAYAELLGNPQSGYVACAERGGSRSIIVSPGGRIVSRRSIPPDRELRGIDEGNRTVVSPRLPSGNTDPARPDVYGDVRVFPRRSSDSRFRIAGRFAAEIEEATQEVVPVADRPEIVANTGEGVVVRRWGPGLARRVEVRMVFTDREAGPVPLHATFWEDSLVSLGHDEVALFVDVENVPKPTVEAIPRLGLGYVPAATRVYENALAVMSLRTGECAFVLRVETPIPMNADVNPIRRSLASLGGGRLLLAHDGQLFSVDVSPRFRVTGTE